MGTSTAGTCLCTGRWECVQAAEEQARPEQDLGLPAGLLEASLPASFNMPKLGFWREVEAPRPMCPQGENIFVHSILMRAAWQRMADRA